MRSDLNRPVLSLHFFWSLVVVVLLVLIIILGLRYFSLREELLSAQTRAEANEINREVLGFAGLFVRDVLQTEDEVDFETRLKLESAVRNLGDEEILTKWKSFIDSKDNNSAQKNVKDLLEILVDKSGG